MKAKTILITFIILNIISYILSMILASQIEKLDKERNTPTFNTALVFLMVSVIVYALSLVLNGVYINFKCISN